MIFVADSFLEHYVKKKTRESYLGAVGCLFLIGFFVIAFYYKSSNSVEFTFNIFVILLIGGALFRSVTIIEGKKLNKIIKEISFGEEIVFISYGYRFLFINLMPTYAKIDKRGVICKEVNFPFNSQGLKNNKTLQVKFNDVLLYIPYECYPDNLCQQLTIQK